MTEGRDNIAAANFPVRLAASFARIDQVEADVASNTSADKSADDSQIKPRSHGNESVDLQFIDIDATGASVIHVEAVEDFIRFPRIESIILPFVHPGSIKSD